MSLLYDTLMWKDGGGQLLPWLAKGYEASPDHLTYTFELRDDVKWSDGQPLTPKDVKFTFDYYKKQVTLGPPIIIQPPQNIADVKEVGAHGIQFTLTTPVVTFLEQVAGAVPIVPEHIWSTIENPADEQDLKILVGSGPYRLTQYNGDGGAMLYIAKDDYFLGPPYVQRIEERGIDDPLAALAGGDADAARGVGLRPDTLAQFRSGGTYGMITDEGNTTSAMYWNLGKEGPLSDVRFRRALTMGIDRQELVTRLAGGRGKPGNPGFLGPNNPFFTSDVAQYPFDVRGANSLLDAAGYPMGSNGIRRTAKGDPLSFEMLINNVESPLAEVLVASAKRIGVELRDKQVEVGPLLFGNKYIGAYDLAVLPFPGPGPGGPNADPDVLRLLFSSRVPASLQAATAYGNEAFNDLAEKQRVTFDQEERKRIVAQMQKMLADDLPILPLYFPETAIVYRKKVLPEWYFTPGQFPASEDNKQLFITGQKTGTKIRGR
jgi:peptide/nickel transport system substrate-binding protein